MPRRLALFDLDHTLLDGDSNDLWASLLADRGVIDAASHMAQNQRYLDAYNAGTLNIEEYLRFTLAPLVGVARETLESWRTTFVHEVIRPRISDAARQLLAQHREAGDYLLVITASNDFITTPIGAELGAHRLIGSAAVLDNGCPTGAVHGTLCFQQGKVERLREWLAETGHTLAGSHFYSDSANDIPLLEQVDHPVAVNADARLAAHAEARGWARMTLRR